MLQHAVAVKCNTWLCVDAMDDAAADRGGEQPTAHATGAAFDRDGRPFRVVGMDIGPLRPIAILGVVLFGCCTAGL